MSRMKGEPSRKSQNPDSDKGADARNFTLALTLSIKGEGNVERLWLDYTP